MDMRLGMIKLEKAVSELMDVIIPQLEIRLSNEISSLRREFQEKLDYDLGLVRSGFSIQPVLDRLKDNIFSWLKPESMNSIKFAPQAKDVDMNKMK